MHTEQGVAPIGYRATPIADSSTTLTPISLYVVNGWRGIGALAIVLGHFPLVAEIVKYGIFRPIVLLVDLFVVLSGLLIAQAYMDEARKESAMPEDIVRRFGRIWPVYTPMLAILFIYEIATLAWRSGSSMQSSLQPRAADGPNPVASTWTNLLLVYSFVFLPPRSVGLSKLEPQRRICHLCRFRNTRQTAAVLDVRQPPGLEYGASRRIGPTR